MATQTNVNSSKRSRSRSRERKQQQGREVGGKPKLIPLPSQRRAQGGDAAAPRTNAGDISGGRSSQYNGGWNNCSSSWNNSDESSSWNNYHHGGSRSSSWIAGTNDQHYNGYNYNGYGGSSAWGGGSGSSYGGWSKKSNSVIKSNDKHKNQGASSWKNNHNSGYLNGGNNSGYVRHDGAGYNYNHRPGTGGSSYKYYNNDSYNSNMPAGALSSNPNSFGKKNWVADWLATSKFGKPVADRFLPLKTPVDPHFDSAIAKEDRFSCLDFFQAMDAAGHEISAVVNLTATTKYYCQTKNAEIIKQDPNFGATWGKDVEWLHYMIQGRQVPPMRQVNQVLNKIHALFDKHPEKKVAIHCTHGVNRTAFFVIAYLLRYGVYEDLEAAKAHFEEQRGETMKRDYLSDGLQELLPQILKLNRKK